LVADVKGAQSLGITAVWRRRENRYEEPDHIEPDFVIDDLRDLLHLPVLRPD
jgi:FMN phosphatase YigB (HAD superfamily)